MDYGATLGKRKGNTASLGEALRFTKADMGRSLVIVESPAKAKTINKYLGRNYSVKASYGHVMDLPKKVLGIDIKHGFEPTYEVSPSKTAVVQALQKAASTADAVYLAGDPDREGEAICSHLADVLSGPKLEFPEEGEEEKKEQTDETGKKGKKKAKKPVKKAIAKGKPVIARKNIFRVMFNEITPKAIKAAFEHPGEINANLVDAQQARRVLDRLVGYKISPLLWDKVRRGLSAGRVQTVALRLIVDREVEIRAFNPVEYWTLHALLAAGEPPVFEAKLTKFKGEDIEVHTQAEADAIVAATRSAAWKVASVAQKEKRRFAPPPFTTSKLQQAAYNRLRYTAKRTMSLAQRLYEGVEMGQEGSVALITYMRTDSVRVSSEAIEQVRSMIGSSFGQPYLPEKPNFFKSKKDAQDAHEAIRPTDAALTPTDVKPFLSEDLFKLYQLIWQRFVASQMVPAVFDQTTIDIASGDYTFRATGSVQKFDGYLAVYQVATGDDEDAEPDSKALLPRVAEGENLRLEILRPEQHFTEPPPRYTEATLVKDLEEKGIGRPSTYASIISTIVDREYVTKDQGRFTPTMLGENSMRSKKASSRGRNPLRNFTAGSRRTSSRPKGKCSPTRRASPLGRSARSADRVNCSSASAATDFFWAVRAIPTVILYATSLPNCPPREPTANPRSRIAITAAAKWSSSGASGALSWPVPGIPIVRRRAA